jgi:hypothetical protein
MEQRKPMAEPNKDDAVVEVTDEAVVQVDVTDNPALAEGEEHPEVKVEGEEPEATTEPKLQVKEKKSAQPRVRITKPDIGEQTSTLQQNLEASEAARKAAEATASSEAQLRIQAEQRAAALAEQMSAKDQEVANSELAVLTSGITAAQTDVTNLEGELARLFEAGDFKGAASVQAKLSKAAATLDRLESSKDEFEAELAQRKAAPKPEPQVTQAQPSGAFENYVRGYSPKSQAWLRQHPDCVPAQVGGDARKNSLVQAAHFQATADGIPVESPEYFARLEKALVQGAGPVSAASKVVEAGTEEGEEEVAAAAPKPAKKAAPQPAAPPSRDVPTGGNLPRTTRQVTLDKDQQEAARISFPHLPPNQAYAAYARNLVELEAEGKLGRVTH